MPEYVLFVVSGYHPDVYFCSVRESSGSRLFFIIFRRLTIGSHVVHCPACHAVINYIPFKEHKLRFILHFCRIFAATFASGGYLPPVPTGQAGIYLTIRVCGAARLLFVPCSSRQTEVFLYLGPPRSANVVIPFFHSAESDPAIDYVFSPLFIFFPKISPQNLHISIKCRTFAHNLFVVY